MGGALVYAFSLVDLGWIPHDDGMLAHVAGRVLDGELPHRDFDDPYTGGQALLHAWAFAAFGERLLTLRLVLFAALAATVPVLYWIARRFAGPAVAALATALAVAWSVPSHPLALPSWYNLFLGVLGVGALLRFQDTGRRRWLGAAGACAGVSILMKIVGLYLLAAVFLHLVFLDQEEATVAAPRADDSASPMRRGGGHRAFVTAGLLTFVLALWALPGEARSPSTLLWLFAPPASLVALLLHREWSRVPRVGAAARTRRLVGRGLIVSAAAAVPVALFLLPYLVGGSLGALVEGALLAPGTRLTVFLKPPPPAATALPLAFVAVLVAFAARSRRADRRVALALGAGLAVVAAGAGASPLLYRAGWWLLYPMAPLVVLVGAARMAAAGDSRRGSAEAKHASRGLAVAGADRFLVLAATAMLALVVFPTYVAHYVFYSAPLVVLAVLATVAPMDRAPRAALSVLLIFHLVFAGLWIHRSEVWRMGDRHNRHPPAERLGMPRGGIRVTPGEAEAYGRLVAALESLGVGPYIWATPDAPEVYFLAGLENPTRTFYDFLDPDFYDPPVRRARLEAMLERHDIGAVVVKRSPALVSPPVSTALREMLVARYPRAAEIGPFVIFVRGEAAAP